MPSTRTGRRKAGRDDIQRRPSSEMPPPGTIMWICGWCVIADPHVWSTAVMPMRAAEVLQGPYDRHHRLRRRAERQIVDDRLVLPGVRCPQPRRKREDDMEVADQQQVGFAFGQPACEQRRPALGQCRWATWPLMRQCPQSSQASTWPPSAAVRQFSIAGT